MATRQQFVDEMNKVYENHGVYVGTGNGELTLSVAGKFFEMEKNYGRRDKDGNPLWYSDTARDYEYLGKCYRKQWDMSKSRVGDCSGQPVGALRRLKVISETADYNCKSFQEAAEEVSLKEVQPADLLFNAKMTYDENKKKYKSTATHMAVYVGSPDYVVESKGRDAGVVKRHLCDTDFIAAGRLDWFDDDTKVLTRILKYIPDNMMRGDDVKEVQQELALEGYNCGTVDGIFGTKTRTAVTQFQYENGLEPDGIVGKNTAEALGFKWEG